MNFIIYLEKKVHLVHAKKQQKISHKYNIKKEIINYKFKNFN